jgi:peptidoglycan/xylan/chitin deacetylase (PgdA/CDA1 family)
MTYGEAGQATGLMGRRAARVLAYARRRGRRGREAHGIVLMYHRIATLSADPWGLGVRPDHFEAQIRELKKHTDIVPLSRLASQLRSGRRSRPVVAITFDDGYADNLTAARPILERHEAPATVFLATGFVGRREEFWWNRLARLLLSGHALPQSHALIAGDSAFRWDDAALGVPGSAGQRACLRLHDRLWNWLCGRPEAERSQVLQELENRLGAPLAADRSAWPMTPEEVQALVAGGLVDIGAHSVTHPMLSRLSSGEKAIEIRQSRADCRRLSGCDPACFAFPHGDLDMECVELVREAGFETACTSESDLVWSSGDAYRMPRIFVRNESGDALLRRLHWYWLA